MLLKFAPFYRLLLAIALSELRQLGTKTVVDLSMDVPQLALGLVLSSGFEVEENIILAGRAISVLVSDSSNFGLAAYIESKSSMLAYVGSFNVSCLRTFLWACSFALTLRQSSFVSKCSVLWDLLLCSL
jgi:hypothetical protein